MTAESPPRLSTIGTLRTTSSFDDVNLTDVAFLTRIRIPSVANKPSNQSGFIAAHLLVYHGNILIFHSEEDEGIHDAYVAKVLTDTKLNGYRATLDTSEYKVSTFVEVGMIVGSFRDGDNITFRIALREDMTAEEFADFEEHGFLGNMPAGQWLEGELLE